MAPNTTGRTTSKWINFIVGDSADVLRNIPVSSVSVVGVTVEEHDMTAFQDAVKGALPGMRDAPIECSGPLDISAAATTPTLSGSHTVLAGMVGNPTPRSIDIQFGMRHAWEAGEPQFGVSKSATSGYILFAYTVDPSSMTYTATFRLLNGSALPAFGTSAEV